MEYNASLPPSLPIQVPYDVNEAWDGSNWFGGGLKVVELIGQAKGQKLVGCDYMGVNAFLVNETEVGDRFQGPFIAEFHHETPKYELTNKMGHPPSQVARAWDSK